MAQNSPLVSTDWLADNLGDPAIRIVDASWHLPTAERDGGAEFTERHIPGAVFFDIDAIAQPDSDLPHMAADPVRFGEMVGELGISETDTIVIYDSVGLFSAARAWWNFAVMGASEVYVLDGGLPAWLAEDRPVESGPPGITPARFTATPAEGTVIAAEQVLAHLENETAQIVDVRPAGRFAGTTPEPRPGLRSGHMPGGLNLPFANLVAEGRLRSAADLRDAIAAAGIDLDRPVISSCGSGVTAPILNLALAQIGHHAMGVYDGAWAEWGGREDLPVTTD